MPCLFRVHTGPYRGKVFPVEATRPLLVGRALEADFTIPDGAIEAFHCRVEFEAGKTGRMAKVIALQAPGEGQLFVDGVPFDDVLLKSGEKVRIGETTLEFREGGTPKDPVEGTRAEAGKPCVACRRPVDPLGGGRVLLGGVYCARCVDLRLIVKRELGRYRVLRKIGRDVAEIVYLAEDLKSEPPERVGLHVLRSERQTDPRVLRRFSTKAASGFGMDSPLFPLTRDLLRSPEVVSYVEDLVDWPTLAERLASGRKLTVHAAARAALKLVEGLRFARRKGMIVGRVRAHKLFISDGGDVRIRDYWLAPALEDFVAKQVGATEVGPLPDPAPAAAASGDGTRKLPAVEHARVVRAGGRGLRPQGRPGGTPGRAPEGRGSPESTRKLPAVEHARVVRADGQGAAAEPPGGRRPPPTAGGSPESVPLAQVGAEAGEDGASQAGAPLDDDAEQMSNEMRRYLAPEPRDLQHYQDESLDVRPVGAVFLQLASGAIQGEPPTADLVKRAAEGFLATRRPSAPAKPPQDLAKLVVRSLARDPQKRYKFLVELSRDLKALMPSL